MVEHWNNDSGIKWQLSEQATENALKSYGMKFVRQSPTGVNHPNVDFKSSVAYFEQKNWYEPINSTFVMENIKAKFDSLPNDNKPRIIVCSRMYKPAKDLCKRLGYLVWEFGKQLVTKKMWKNYTVIQKKHSTSHIWNFIYWLHSNLASLTGKVKRGSKGSDNSVEVDLLENGTLTIEDQRGDYFFVMIENQIEPDIPFFGSLKLCEHCNTLHYWNGRFCSMQCFHKWGGPRRAKLEKSQKSKGISVKLPGR